MDESRGAITSPFPKPDEMPHGTGYEALGKNQNSNMLQLDEPRSLASSSFPQSSFTCNESTNSRGTWFPLFSMAGSVPDSSPTLRMQDFRIDPTIYAEMELDLSETRVGQKRTRYGSDYYLDNNLGQSKLLLDFPTQPSHFDMAHKVTTSTKNLKEHGAQSNPIQSMTAQGTTFLSFEEQKSNGGDGEEEDMLTMQGEGQPSPTIDELQFPDQLIANSSKRISMKKEARSKAQRTEAMHPYHKPGTKSHSNAHQDIVKVLGPNLYQPHGSS